MIKSEKALKTIGEAAQIIKVEPHVIRFWEENFSNFKPIKYNNRRYYSYENIETLKQIKDLLYNQNLSIKEAATVLKKSRPNVLSRIQDKLIAAKKRLNAILAKTS